VRRLPRLPRLPQRLRLPLRRGLWRLRRLQLLYFVGILPRLLEPIQEVIESDESVVILCWAFDSRGGAPDVEAGTSHCCGPQRSSLSE
jgi:hypothetical protein